MSRHHIILVPGFFGFGSLGALTYFAGVREALGRAFQRLSLDVDVVEVPTLPTASIRHRAARVQETLARVARLEPGPLHIVGHSTGGLDARLAIAPTASLPTQERFRDHARLRSLVTISTPHFGTPVASFFGSAAGYPLLKLVASILTSSLKRGHLPLAAGLRLGNWLMRADDAIGLRNTIADEFFRAVIANFSLERRAEIMAFIQGISRDQSLIFQLTPAGCDLLNASTADPDSLRYGSVVCRAPAPRLSNLLALKHDPYAQTMHAIYATLYRIAAFAKTEPLPPLVPEQRQMLERAFAEAPSRAWSDGLVPTLSQVWGQVVHAAYADHLDVVGHYGSTRGGDRTSDWLPSCSGFDDAAFDALWNDVAHFITEEARSLDTPSHRRNVGVERTEIELTEARRPREAASEVVTAREQARRALLEIDAPEAPGSHLLE